MKLIYQGHQAGGAIPLPEGWPAYDHDEQDSDTATAKLASGMYDAESAGTSKPVTNEEEDNADGDSI